MTTSNPPNPVRVDLFLQKRIASSRSRLMNFFKKYSSCLWDAEELTQDVFCKMIKSNELVDENYPDAYLYTVAWSVLRDRWRRERVRQQSMHVELDNDMECAGVDICTCPVQIAESTEQYMLFLNVLDSLTPKTRNVFLMSRYEGLTYSEIARECSLSTSAVEKHMMKALSRFGAVLNKHDRLTCGG